MFRAGMKNMFLVTGTIMGAGYASGREIWQFFGVGSGLAIMIFTILFTFCTVTILRISYEAKSKNYLPVLHVLMGKKVTRVYDLLILVYLFCVTVVMIAGSGATFKAFGVPFIWGLVFIIIGLIIIFSKGIGELLQINQIIMPVMMLALLLTLWIFITDEKISTVDNWQQQQNWMAAFPFTALNILPLVAVLGAIGYRIESKGEIYIAAISSGCILGTITFIYNISLVHISTTAILPDIPLFAIINNYGEVVMLIMMVMLWLAIYTTAAATLLGLISRVNEKYEFPLIRVAILFLIIMVPFSAIGFSQLVAFIYPLYGVLNLYLLGALVLYPFLDKIK